MKKNNVEKYGIENLKVIHGFILYISYQLVNIIQNSISTWLFNSPST
ncbi:MAG: hypothetical protein GY705_24150 [Bacteroidetes bacterium]|nr:hypothetical protein [Bacteroidota bacterium]